MTNFKQLAKSLRPRAGSVVDRFRPRHAAAGTSPSPRSAAILRTWPLLPALSLAVLGICSSQASAPDRCRSVPLSLRLGTEASATMNLGRGMACALIVRNLSSTVDDIVFDAEPRFGRLTPRGRTGVIYRAAPDFSGTDHFVISLKGRTSGKPERMTVRVDVAVR